MRRLWAASAAMVVRLALGGMPAVAQEVSPVASGPNEVTSEVVSCYCQAYVTASILHSHPGATKATRAAGEARPCRSS